MFLLLSTVTIFGFIIGFIFLSASNKIDDLENEIADLELSGYDELVKHNLIVSNDVKKIQEIESSIKRAEKHAEDNKWIRTVYIDGDYIVNERNPAYDALKQEAYESRQYRDRMKRRIAVKYGHILFDGKDPYYIFDFWKKRQMIQLEIQEIYDSHKWTFKWRGNICFVTFFTFFAWLYYLVKAPDSLRQLIMKT